jgi:hypothetical protein
MRSIAAVLILALAAGCATVEKMESGDQAIGERMKVTLDGPWNKMPTNGPAQVWTMEGLAIDQLVLFPGVKDGELVHAQMPGGQKNFAFKSGMQPDEIVALFEGALTRGGSQFTLVKLEPAAFGGAKGFRFEYSLVRRVDNVQLSGLGYGAVNGGELYALLYQAPRLAFFPRHQARVEHIAKSALIGVRSTLRSDH